MTTVVTAGSGDTYRIEGSISTATRLARSPQDYNRNASIEPVHVEQLQSGAPPGPTRPVLAGAVMWERVPISKRGGELWHTRDGERRDDFDIRRQRWTGDALAEPR